MPIVIDWVNDEEVGPIIEEVRLKGERRMLVRQIEKRFGTVPQWAAERLEAMPVAEIEDLALRVLDAASLPELLG